jgi:hypothetical protein
MKRAGFESQLGYRAGIAVVRSAMSSMEALGGAGGAWLDLAIRFWLAKGFLIAATLSMAMHAPLTMAFASPVSPTVDWLIASPLGATIATVCPILLLVGCCSRLACLPLLFQAFALQGPQGPSPLHLFWGVLLGWIIVHGPGSLSVDAVLSRGLVSTAIPGLSGLGQAVTIAARIVEPWYRLALRLWIATAPLAVGAAVSCGRRGQDVAGAVACELSGCGGRSAGRLARCRKPAHLRAWDARRLYSSCPCRPYLASRDAARRTSLLAARTGDPDPLRPRPFRSRSPRGPSFTAGRP